MTIRIEPLEPAHAEPAAALFERSLADLRDRVSALPRGELDVAGRLARMEGVAAIDEGRLVGYLASWYPIERFRAANRSGAYVPEWGHAAVGPERIHAYRSMYRAASSAWAAAGCDVHALTLLAGDDDALDTWFWNGFGMGTVDAVRTTTPIDTGPPSGTFSVRRATVSDASALAALDGEHVLHYAAPPVLMARPDAFATADWRRFLGRDRNTAWLAEDQDGPFGFIRFDREFDGSDVIASDHGVFVSGAYVRGTRRRRGAAVGMLDAAMRHYADVGVDYCGVDFEAFNPEAAAFWPRYFTPACYSLMRVPESRGQ